MNRTLAATLALTLALPWSTPDAAASDKRVRCESHGYRHTVCGIPDHGYVRLDHQRSSTRCVQGRNWDYNHREIWVDDGCGADFIVETRHGSSKHEGEKAVAAVAAIALLGAVLSNADQPQHHQDSADRGRGGHDSHVPDWMHGEFVGYNESQRAEVRLAIHKDSRVEAQVNGVQLRGYVNGERLYVGDAIFELQRSGDGFYTTQVGHWDNRVRYRRR